MKGVKVDHPPKPPEHPVKTGRMEQAFSQEMHITGCTVIHSVDNPPTFRPCAMPPTVEGGYRKAEAEAQHKKPATTFLSHHVWAAWWLGMAAGLGLAAMRGA